MTHTNEWFIINETHAPDLVCRRAVRRAGVHGEEIGGEEIPGPVMIITEHRYRLDASGLVIGLVDTRTRLVVRVPDEVMGNGSEYGGTPLVVSDDEVYQNFVFTARDARAVNDADTTDVTSGSAWRSAELGALYSAHAQVMRTLDEITRLRDDVVQIRDATLRAASATREARGR